MIGYQASRRKVLGRKERFIDRERRVQFGCGILLPGITVLDDDGEEKKIWDNPAQDEINTTDTPFFRSALDLYYTFKTCNVLPHGKGSLAERTTTVKIIRIFESESNRYDSWSYKHHDELDDDEGDE